MVYRAGISDVVKWEAGSLQNHQAWSKIYTLINKTEYVVEPTWHILKKNN